MEQFLVLASILLILLVHGLLVSELPTATRTLSRWRGRNALITITRWRTWWRRRDDICTSISCTRIRVGLVFWRCGLLRGAHLWLDNGLGLGLGRLIVVDVVVVVVVVVVKLVYGRKSRYHRRRCERRHCSVPRC